jgi:MFS family permease
MSMPTPRFLRTATSDQRKTLLAASLGWMLDAFDVMLLAMVLPHVMRNLGIALDRGGLITTATLIASGLGGLLFGWIADHSGRRLALTLSILTYSVCSFLSGLAQNLWQLAAIRFVLGLGMGGEWNTGATLVAETWPTEHRAKALSLVQSSWAIGYALAAATATLVLQFTDNWRLVFFVGVLPALLTLWVRRHVPESAMFAAARREAPVPFRTLLGGPLLRPTLALLAMNMFALFGWWGLFSWLPPYLVLPPEQGGRGLTSWGSTQFLIVLNLAGMLPGYFAFGFLADRIGRKRTFALYLFGAAALVLLYALQRDPFWVFWLGIPVAFCGTGFFSGSGLVASEIFPTAVRSRALGFTYNGARLLSALAPYTIGVAGKKYGLDMAFVLCAIAFLAAGIASRALPETRGVNLE